MYVCVHMYACVCTYTVTLSITPQPCVQLKFPAFSFRQEDVLHLLGSELLPFLQANRPLPRFLLLFITGKQFASASVSILNSEYFKTRNTVLPIFQSPSREQCPTQGKAAQLTGECAVRTHGTLRLETAIAGLAKLPGLEKRNNLMQ